MVERLFSGGHKAQQREPWYIIGAQLRIGRNVRRLELRQAREGIAGSQGFERAKVIQLIRVCSQDAFADFLYLFLFLVGLRLFLRLILVVAGRRVALPLIGISGAVAVPSERAQCCSDCCSHVAAPFAPFMRWRPAIAPLLRCRCVAFF